MESVLESLVQGNESTTLAALLVYNDKNKTNFSLGESVATRETFCKTLLDQLSSGRWSAKTQAAALTSLRIAAREKEGVKRLRSKEGLRVLVDRADLSHDIKESCLHDDTPATQDRIEVIVEAVKCLCNLVLSSHSLATTCTDLGVLHGLSLRLRLVRNRNLPPDIMTFDLRLLFLITACGVAERVKFREEYSGLTLLVNIIDVAIFGCGGQEVVTMERGDSDGVTMETRGENSAQPSAEDSVAMASRDCVPSSDERGPDKYSLPLPPSRGAMNILSAPLSEERMGWVSEAMKVVFNQTVHWKEAELFTEDELTMLSGVTVLVRILLVSIPFQLSKLTTATVTHCVEVLVNVPLVCARELLLPQEVQLMPTLRERYPALYPETQCSGGAACSSVCGDGRYGVHLDEVCEGWNMSACSCLLLLLIHSLDTSSSTVSTVLTVLRNISKGHRCIRRFLKNKILPPLREVTQRPEQEDSLKGRLVRLMTASGNGTEGVASEFLFVLCKEDSSRLIKYTGYGNAAGLLLSRGLLGGGRSDTAAVDYSSDSGDSDTEDYVQSKPSIDPMTGGPSVRREGEGEGEGREGGGEGSRRLEDMTEEEKEAEAVRLVEMMRRLNEHGVIRVLPMDGQQRDILNEDPLVDPPLD